MNRKDVEKELDEFEKQHQRIPLQVNYRWFYMQQNIFIF